MRHSSVHIVGALKAARLGKGLSQRELCAKAGVPQGHISKIENNAVDLRLSSLIALARILDLEIMAVPRKLVPAVQALTRGSGHASENEQLATKQIKRIEKIVTRLAAGKPADEGDLARLQRAARSLSRLPVEAGELDALRKAADAVRRRERGLAPKNALENASARLERARNTLMHRVSEEPASAPRPAYSLQDGDEDA